MARFCSQCGRPLEEGEVCTCTQQMSNAVTDFQAAGDNAQQTNAQQAGAASQFSQQAQQTFSQAADQTKALVKRIVPIIKNPVEELKAIAKTGETKLGVQLIVCNIIVTFLVFLIAMIALRIKVGDYAKYVKLPYVQTVVLAVVTSAIVYFGRAAILFGFTKAFSKGAQVTFGSAVTVVGAKALYDCAVMIVGGLLMLLNSQVGLFVLLAGYAFTYLLMVISYVESVELSSNAKLYVLAITFVCVLLIQFIIMKIGAESVVSKLLGSMGGLLGSSLGDLS